MIHISCDLCGTDLTESGQSRYVVRIEAFPGFDPTTITEEDLDADPMEAVSALLRQDEHLSSDELATPINKAFRFDLCACCHKKYLNDPLGRDMSRTLDFSKN
jgi:hypothetical protein